MKTLTFNKKSLHYKIALWSVSNQSWYWTPDNMCQYIKDVLLGMFRMFLLGCICICSAIMISKITVEAAFGTYYHLVYGYNLFTDAGIAGVIIYGFLLVGIFVFILFYIIAPYLVNKCGLVYNRYIKTKATKTVNVKKDSFVKNAYDSIKNKYCIKIKFE